MDEEDTSQQATGRSINTTADTTARSGERNCTQKLTIPILDKYDTTNVKLWWRRFIQYVKMTKEIDLAEMTTSREIREEHRELLENEVKDIFISSYGLSAKQP